MVLFHADVPGIPGGFTGVDVFFVISGFLITRQLLGFEHRSAVETLREFYARRVRRILPGLAVVLVAVLVLGRTLLLPYGEQQELAKGALTSALLVSNVFFWSRLDDYFAPPSALQPLLHTWSLSIEEQFYLAWPRVFITLTRLGGSRGRAWAVAMGTLVSFVACAWLSLGNSFTAFYWLPTRAWELGVGAMLALPLWATRMPPGMGAPGLAAIAAGVFAITAESDYPGLVAAVPVLGTALVIQDGIRSRDGIVTRALSSPALVAIGKVSYAWYLWHWPLISIARMSSLGQRYLARDLALAAVALGLAFVTTRFIEMPIRERRVFPFAADGRSLVSGAVLALACIALSAALLVNSRSQFDREYGPAFPATSSCRDQYSGGAFVPDEKCVLSTGSAGTIFLIGDSFADHWAPAIATWGREHDVRSLHRSISGCPVVLAPHLLPQGERCDRFSAIVLEEIRAAAGRGVPVGAVISNKWVNYAGEDNDAKAAQFRAAWAKTLEALAAIGVRVVVIGPTPRFPYSVPTCLARRGADSCRIPRSSFDHEATPVNRVLRTSCTGACRAWMPADRLCDASWCYATHDGKPSFTDWGHLSRYATQASVPDLAPHLGWLVER